MTNRRVEIIVGNETHIAHITVYQRPQNTAIQTYDSEGAPYCKVTTNPIYVLPAGVVALRDDYEMVIGETRDALIKAGVIELIEPRQEIRLGYTTATLYRVLD